MRTSAISAELHRRDALEYYLRVRPVRVWCAAASMLAKLASERRAGGLVLVALRLGRSAWTFATQCGIRYESRVSMIRGTQTESSRATLDLRCGAEAWRASRILRGVASSPSPRA